MKFEQINKTPTKIQYIRDLFAKEDELLKEFREKSIKFGRPISIGAEEGKLLQLFIKMNKIKNIIELGTLTGYSALWMAKALPEDGKIYTIEFDPTCINISKENFAKLPSDLRNKIELLEGKALDKLKELEKSPKKPQSGFDMIFIDADKNNYVNYLDWAEKNIKKGGLIVGDNTFLFGAVYSDDLPHRTRPTTKEAMQEFNRRLADSNKFDGVILPTEEGMTVAIKK